MTRKDIAAEARKAAKEVLELFPETKLKYYSSLAKLYDPDETMGPSAPLPSHLDPLMVEQTKEINKSGFLGK